ncbi:hypothetical protein H9Q13_10935 [Pontibacter sp. JH31]|uniref:Uncharacterized protein n=1 Tax=Pontibacter aquaedesilientis TaxID=2766980 RepID=A0ABR7XHA5_9BACT|nr:hypothetical protein [Pontibacter aquaedesilientis]MBD1397680.1 hypothetical protein [Pontibacter aquaedesilientis]
MKIYDSFVDLIDKAVLPLKKENPDWQRLDGGVGGNRSPFAYFRHNEKVWRVNSDTRFAPLLKAKHAIDSGQNPFKPVKNRLELIPELASKPKHIYVYLYGV